MDAPQGPAAPASGKHAHANDDRPISSPAVEHIPTFEDLAADPEIAPLLEFEPVPRKVIVDGGWSPDAQREYIARLAVLGSPSRACDELGKNRSGVTKLYRSPHGGSFRAAWDGAVALAKRRRTERGPPVALVRPGTTPPSLDYRRTSAPRAQDGPLPGQAINELGEWEDEASLNGRIEDARDSISSKLLRSRRLYLKEIRASPGKRAAFEMLTALPIDWDKAGRLEAQPDEPWRPPSLRKPDMLLTAEAGWLGDVVHGPDKLAELREAIDAWRAEQGMEPLDWSESTEASEQARSDHPHAAMPGALWIG
jgi:hypothetical protein